MFSVGSSSLFLPGNGLIKASASSLFSSNAKQPPAENNTKTDFKTGKLSKKHQDWLMGFIIGVYSTVISFTGYTVLHKDHQRNLFNEQSKLYSQIDDLLEQKTNRNKWLNASHMARRLKLDLHKARVALKLLEHPAGNDAKVERIINSIKNNKLRGMFKDLHKSANFRESVNNSPAGTLLKKQKYDLLEQINKNQHIYSRTSLLLIKLQNYLDSFK